MKKGKNNVLGLILYVTVVASATNTALSMKTYWVPLVGKISLRLVRCLAGTPLFNIICNAFRLMLHN